MTEVFHSDSIADDNGDIWEEDLNHDSFSVMEISQTELEANTSRILLDQNTNNEFEPQWRRKNRTPTSAATIHVTKDGSDDINDEVPSSVPYSRKVMVC